MSYGRAGGNGSPHPMRKTYNLSLLAALSVAANMPISIQRFPDSARACQFATRRQQPTPAGC